MLVLFLALATAPYAQAQCYPSEAETWADVISYNGLRWSQTEGQGGSYYRQLGATQMHNDDYCDAYVQSEAWTNPGGTPGVATNGKGTPQWAVGTTWGAVYGWVSGTSRHWYINWTYPSGGWQWILVDELNTSVFLGWNPQDIYDCVNNQSGTWNYQTGTCDIPSPILIDLGGRGYYLTSAAHGVSFDIDADGVIDTIAWTRAGAQNAFLVLDRNGNGLIDDGRELFGTATPLATGSAAPNGFAELAEYDLNHDGRIDDSDPVYTELRLWTDLNHNGYSEQFELQTTTAAGVSAIFLLYEVTNRRDNHGNLFWLRGLALVRRDGVDRPRNVYDVIFAAR